jgi:hypothetical protein
MTELKWYCEVEENRLRLGILCVNSMIGFSMALSM